MCGWCKDKWGLSWQITPRALTEAMAASGAEAKRVFEAMMKMQKIDVAAIEPRVVGKEAQLFELAVLAFKLWIQTRHSDRTK